MSSFKKHPEDDLQIIVENYQKGDSYAAERLRQLFYPLIFRLSHRQSMYSTFGEDAENIAWLLFFEFILAYKGHDFIRLPGLVRRFLIFRLARLMQQQGMRWDMEVNFEDDALANEAGEYDFLGKLLNKLALEQAVKTLSEQDTCILEELFFKDNTVDELAHNLHCTPRSVRNHKKHALARLRKQLKG